MSYPKNYKYTKEHEWAELLSPTQIRIGITDHAQSSLGDIVYLDLPPVGRELKANETFGVVESIKAVSDLYSPVSGVVTQANADLVADPGKLNQDAHQEWLIIVDSASAKEQFDQLMSSENYESYIKTL